MKESVSLREVFNNSSNYIDKSVDVKGWVRSVRVSKKFSFVVINDGTCHKDFQAIIDSDVNHYDEIKKLMTGASISLTGKIVISHGKNQTVEMQANSFTLIGLTDDSYPLQKKKTSLEFLREKAHLRARTRTISAALRIRHVISKATHDFFDENEFYYVNTPIITASDCEGAGDMFKVTTLNIDTNNKSADNPQIKDYFHKPTFLTVSGQLEGEALALGLGKIYTFGPTFRSENSNTSRHLSEFWMIEPEVSFAGLNEICLLSENYIKYFIKETLKKCQDEIDFLEKTYSEGLKDRLENVISSRFNQTTYTKAIEILKEASKKTKFEYPVEWGSDLQTEHERYLAEVHFKGPVIVTDYPKEIKSFYMKLNEDGKTVKAMDVLLPGVGEIIGGSEREDDYNLLLDRMKECGLKEDDYWWYLDLRKYGSVPHAGFGLGLERAVMYVTGLSNIRDVIPFPRYPGHAEF